MNKYTIYHRHGVPVAVREDLKGKHRQHCLCYKCHFWDGCEIRKAVYELNVEHNITTPVWECPRFAEGEEHREPLGKIRLLENLAIGTAGEEYDIVTVDKEGNIYFYDEFDRWTMLEEAEEGEQWERI